MNPFVPIDFHVPELLETDKVRLRMLTVNDVVKDYDAVMTSIRHLQKSKPFGPQHYRPSHDLSFEQDLIDLGRHQKEFQRRSSFAYTVMSLDEKECLWCVYIYRSPNSNYDAEIVLRVRESKIVEELDDHLFFSVKQWIEEKWPFKKPWYPGRDVDWETYLSMDITARQGMVHNNNPGCTVWEYPSSEHNISIAKALIHGRYPTTWLAKNLHCEQAYYVLSWSGTITMWDQTIDAHPGEVIMFKKHEPYYVVGEWLEVLIYNTPKWTVEQYCIE